MDTPVSLRGHDDFGCDVGDLIEVYRVDGHDKRAECRGEWRTGVVREQKAGENEFGYARLGREALP